MAIYKLNCDIHTKKTLKNGVLEEFNILMIELSKYIVQPINVIKVSIIKNKNKHDQMKIIRDLCSNKKPSPTFMFDRGKSFLVW